MEGASRFVSSNVALRRPASALGSNDQIDVSKTSAAAAVYGGAIFVNSTDWKDGIVSPERRAAVKRAAPRRCWDPRSADQHGADPRGVRRGRRRRST
jgi:hypothetical protein